MTGQVTGSRVTVRDTDYVIMNVKNAAASGSKFWGRFVFTVRLAVDDGRRWSTLAKRVAHNTRLEPVKCAYCGGLEGPLEPFNQQYNLACSDTTECKRRQLEQVLGPIRWESCQHDEEPRDQQLDLFAGYWAQIGPDSRQTPDGWSWTVILGGDGDEVADDFAGNEQCARRSVYEWAAEHIQEAT